MNSKILRGLFGILLLSALLGLVLTDVGGFFRSGGFGRTDLAKVGRIKLNIPEFDALYRRQLQMANITPDQAQQVGLPQMILQQEVTRQVMLQAANRVGISVSNAYVAQHLKKQLKDIPVPGSEKDKLDAVLRNMGISEQAFVESVRSDTAVHVLSNTINDQKKQIPDAMIKAVAAADTQERRAQIITIRSSDLPAMKTPDDKALQSYLDENKTRYEIPEQRNIRIATIKQDNIVPNVTVADKDIDAYYESNQDQFKVASRARFTQAIAGDEKTAKTIYDAAKATSLADAAKTAKVRIMASDWYDQGTLPDGIEAAVFAGDKSKPGLLEPVQSPLGWHVIQTEEYKDESVKPLSEVKSVVADMLRQEQTDNAVNSVTEEIEQEAADGVDVDKIVEPYKGLTQSVGSINKINAMQKLAGLNLPKDSLGNVLDAIFTLNENDVSPIIESKDGAYILVQIKNVTEPRLPKLAEIKGAVSADWTKTQTALALDKKADAVIGDYDIKKPDLKAIAARHNLGYRETGLLDGNSKELPQNVMSILFNLSPQNDLTSVKTDDGAVVIRVSEIKTEPLSAVTVNSKQSEDMRAALTQELQQQFVSGWRDYLGVDINMDLLAKTYLKSDKAQD